MPKWLVWFLIILAIGALSGFVLIKFLMPGVTISSWFRNPIKNLRVGGKTLSLHQIGWAWDIVPPTLAVEMAARRIFPSVLNEGDHIHVQLI